MPNFHDVLAEERTKEILNHPGRRPQHPSSQLIASAEERQESPIVGLALSGGGIRSATFNLGVLQGLAKIKLLEQIDYLSTVSGGGYIGSWLITWIKRTSTREVQQKLGNYEAKPDTEATNPIPEPEPEEINFLRDYSNYLTPRMGIFGADTWAGISTYLRNVFLNQLILVAFLATILFLPWIAVLGRVWIPDFFQSSSNLAVLTGALIVFTVVMASYQVALCSRTGKPSPSIAEQPMVLFSVVLPLFLASLSMMEFLWIARMPTRLPPMTPPGQDAFFWLKLTGILYGAAHLLGLIPRYLVTRNLREDQKPSPWAWPVIPISAAVAGAVGGLLVFELTRLIACWQTYYSAQAIWYAASFGPPLIVLIFLVIGALHIGLLRLLIEPEEQEWWARLSGWLLILSIAWVALFSLAIFAPFGELYLTHWAATKFTLIGGWILTTAGGLLAGRSKSTNGTSSSVSPALDRFASIAPYVFVVGLLAVLSVGVYEVAGKPPSGWLHTVSDLIAPQSLTSQAVPSLSDKYWSMVRSFSPGWLATCCIALFAISFFLAWRIEVNRFSMNLFYRDRLVRCYLGATRPEKNRHANPFTGFDPQDDLLLKNFAQQPSGPGSEKEYDGPYPLFCAALNITHGERLAWQERKAESFVFTPRFCGFDFPEMHLIPGLPDGFRPTYEFAYPRSSDTQKQKEVGGVHVGTAMSISGAAASPNMGFHTSPPLAFLMTLFDVRLGWWLPNPRYAPSKHLPPEGGPRLSLIYLLKELFASTTDRSKYVYVSDGGHFENIGIYELVRRRCRYIIACDADADAGMAFGDLGNAIRKCRSDFGVEITIDPTPVRITSSGFAQRHAVVGTIRYPQYTNESPAPALGKLLYIKATVTEGVPADVLAYRAQDPTFPDKTTADQWFEESQFESYRRLGQYSVESLLEAEPPQRAWTAEQLINVVERTQSWS